MDYLRTRPGQTLCVACIARALDVDHKRAHQATLKLEAAGNTLRAYGRCSMCQKTRLIAAVFGSVPAQRPLDE